MNANLTMQEIIDEIFDYGFTGKKFDLENISRILQELGNPEKSYKVIHVAGTNGKGSVSTTIETILLEAGYKVGKFTSPHILKVNERVNIDGEPISDEDFIKQYKIIKAVLEKIDLVPTFFEFITALMFNYFKEKKIEYLVLEVGLGGRLDSTNVADGEIAVITNISLDHVRELGDTYSKIAFEKAGIIKENSQVVIGEWKEESLLALKEVLKEKKFKNINFTKEKYERCSTYSLDFENFITEIEMRYETKDKKYSFSLFGEHQYENFLTAYEVVKLLGISDEIVERAIKKVYWQCRFEVIKKHGKIVVLDGAHNMAGITHLKETLLKHYTPEDILTITSILEDKEIKPMLKEITDFSNQLVLTSLSDVKRGVSGEKIKEVAEEILKTKNSKTKLTVIEDVLESYSYGLKSSEKVVVICGSFYLLSKIKEGMKGEKE